MENKLNKFGKFLVDHLRDKGIEKAVGLLNGEWKTPSLLSLQADLSQLSADQKQMVIKTVTNSIDTAIHDFLFALQEQADHDICIVVEGENITELSDDIHGEAYSDEGWYATYSKFGEPE